MIVEDEMALANLMRRTGAARAAAFDAFKAEIAAIEARIDRKRRIRETLRHNVTVELCDLAGLDAYIAYVAKVSPEALPRPIPAWVPQLRSAGGS